MTTKTMSIKIIPRVLKFAIFILMTSSIATINAADNLSLSQSRWTQNAYDLAVSGDAKKGKKLAKKCVVCHGENGVSEDNETPSLAGQKPAYTFKQIYDYKHKIRANKTMYKKTKKLSYADMADISAWYKIQKGELRLGKNAPKIVSSGDKSRFLIACDMCHNSDIMPGGFQVPILEGQKIDYLIETLTAFKENDRENDEYGVMQKIAKLLSTKEIEEIARYYAAKPIVEAE